MIDRREFLKRLGFVAAAAAIAPSVFAPRPHVRIGALPSGQYREINATPRYLRLVYNPADITDWWCEASNDMREWRRIPTPAHIVVTHPSIPA